MTGSTAIDTMAWVFSAVTLLGIGALFWRFQAGLPRLVATRFDRDAADHKAALSALAQAYGRAPSEALVDNYRWHRNALLRLDPKFDTSATDAAFASPLANAA